MTESDRTPQEVREEIERTRLQMGDTVAALAAKADVKGQAHRAVDNAKATVTGKAHGIRSTADAKRTEFTASAREAMPPSAEAARQGAVEQAQRHRLALAALVAFGAGMIIGRRRAR
jgi:transposase-like protein